MRAELLGKLRRLPAMSPAEVAYRLGEAARREASAAALRLGMPRAREEAFLRRLPGARTMGFLPFLRATLSARFYLPSGDAARHALARAFTESFPHRLETVVDVAERICDHRLELLGCGEVELGGSIDWHRDPLTGRRWPLRPWPSYDPVREHAAGDAKRIFEINRHQHLPRLAKAWYLTGEERYAREAVRQLLEWIEQNPRGVGIHWNSSLELALRSLAWLWTLAFLDGSRALDETAARRIGSSLCAQLDHVLAYPSLYSAPNTHLLGEATALFVAGTLFGEAGRGPAWRARGVELIDSCLDGQLETDGWHSELSDCYHCYAVDFLIQAWVLGRRTGRPLTPRAAVRIERMLEVLAEIARSDGSLPRLGDDDGGRALGLAETSYRDARDLLATGAILFGRGDFKRLAGGLGEESLWLLGADAGERFRSLAESAPRATRADRHAAGYHVRRSGWGRDDAHLLFDCGGLGRLGGGHGHADALSVTLHAGGRDLLVDAGTYVYNGDPVWRDHFRSTRAHNTVVVDGRDQSEPGGTFRWRRSAKARLVGEAAFEDFDYLAGEHDGYTALGVVHRRRLLGAGGEWWVVLDELVGTGEHEVELCWQLAADAEPGEARVARGGREASVEARAGRAGLALSIHATVPFRLERARGAVSPPRGWVSRRYGEKRPATALVARMRAELPVWLLTVLSPFADGSDALASSPFRARSLPVWQTAEARRPALAVALRRGGVEEIVVVAPGRTEVQAGACRVSAEIACARFASGRPERLFAVGAERFSHRGEEWLDGAEPVAWRRFAAVERGAVLEGSRH